jgi:cytochrome oxidase Cu insertion factor (SCO1/SenC/PrrC family)/Cu/Ag efflux protein CusF
MAMGVLMRRGVCALAIVLIAVITSACERADGGPGYYSAHGTVEDVDPENGQILIDHGDVEGLMSAMTMNFAVPDQDLLATLAPGQVIDFEIHFTGRSYEVVEAKVVGEASEQEGWFHLREGLVRTSPAPPFDLIDQAARPVSLTSLGDQVLVVDFIYTSCPGPCPVQTSIQVALQRQIPDRLRDDVHFISISLDPRVDRPEVLEQYAKARGADLTNWSFLTGPTEQVAEVVREWGVGSVRKDDGTIDHTLVRFLVRDGRVIERYWTSEQRDEALLADLTALAEERDANSASAAGGRL